eukprot:273834-Chlamydomonas_euryale.AAC.1
MAGGLASRVAGCLDGAVGMLSLARPHHVVERARTRHCTLLAQVDRKTKVAKLDDAVRRQKDVLELN